MLNVYRDQITVDTYLWCRSFN